MKKLVVYLALIGLLCSFGCMPVASPLMGGIYAEVQGPVLATSNPAPANMKVGEAEAQTILGLIAQGDCSIEAAAQDGGITKIHHVDHETTNILGIIATYKTIVYGQ